MQLSQMLEIMERYLSWMMLPRIVKKVKQYKRRKYNIRQKRNKDALVKHLLMLPIHNIDLVPFANRNDINGDVQEEIKVSDAMLQRIHK